MESERHPDERVDEPGAEGAHEPEDPNLESKDAAEELAENEDLVDQEPGSAAPRPS